MSLRACVLDTRRMLSKVAFLTDVVDVTGVIGETRVWALMNAHTMNINSSPGASPVCDMRSSLLSSVKPAFRLRRP